MVGKVLSFLDGIRVSFAASAICLALFLPQGVLAQQNQQKEETPKQTNERIQQLADAARAHPVDTPIGSGDLLHVDVFDVPELSRDLRVSDAGDISFPLIPGKIRAAGLTSFQLESQLEQLLVENGLVSHPQVSVFVKEQNSQPISVVGAVAKPMVYQVIRPTTLLEVLADAGGISDDAGSVVIVTRPTHPGEARLEPASESSNSTPDQQIITVRLQDLLDSGDMKYNIPVYGGDVISVPKAGIVYVMGAGVAQQGGYVVQNHGEQITVLRAIALAHGLTVYAKKDHAIIMRTNPLTGQKDEIPVRIKDIEKHKADDLAMKSNDILYVPDSAGLKILARGGEAAIGIGTSVAVYRAAYQ
ncbi:MAG TPA: polysaccharide biosynthesis/export family protein [Candidatus Limnocylindrales bacterium]|nr:polysaccharide biosynthesis/export family protein [Candidatus Limnocylindrales bacterium]